MFSSALFLDAGLQGFEISASRGVE